MHRPVRLAALAAALTLVAFTAAPAASAAGRPRQHGADHVVFVQTNDPSGNRVLAYARSDDGLLSPAGSYPTGGLGGILDGAVSDTLASQGSLTYDPASAHLYAVNAGSSSLTVFDVRGDHLVRRQVVGSTGEFPVSVAVHDDLVYVLNARDGGSVAGYRMVRGRLSRIRFSYRNLGLDPDAGPEFLTSAGQVGFTPDGRHLVVTTKANGHDVLVFGVRPNGQLERTPVRTSLDEGTVPFAFVFDGAGRLVLTHAATGELATYDVNPDGTLTGLAVEPGGQGAPCWIVEVDGRYYVSNTATSNVSIFDGDGAGGLSVRPEATPTDLGTIDSAVSEDGRYLYVQAGTVGIVDVFRIEADGSLTAIGSTVVPGGAGFEGIVAA